MSGEHEAPGSQAVRLPVYPSNGIAFTAAHTRTLIALADTYISPMAPALSKEMVSRFAVSDEHAEEVRRFCALSGGETSAVSKLMDALNDPLMVPKKTADQLALGVQLLTSWWGSFLLTGYPSAFESLSRADRAAAVEGMLTSSLELRRSFAHGMRCLLCIIALSSVTPPTAVNPKGISSPFTPLATAANTPSGAAFAARASDGSSPRPGVRSNPSHAAMQYPGPDPDGDHARSLQARRLAFRHEPIVLPPPGASPALAASALAAAAAGQAPSPLSAVAAAFAGELARRAGVPRAFLPHVIITPAALQLLNVHCGVSASSASVSSPFESAFGPNNINPATGLLIPPNVALDSDSALPTLALAADVVIIGSGAGGGVAAAALARDGRRVLVLEKGQYYSPDELNHIEEDSMQSMYEGRSLLTTDDGGMAILAGATLGGGTTVNWACSLDLPHYVRHEWARHHALPFVASPVFARALESVSRRVGVHCGDSVARAHSGPNTLLLRGAKALGHPAVTLPQNTPGPGAHNCGWCGMGCRTGTKQGSQFSFLRDAVEKGAKVITGCYVEKIIIRDAADISAGASAGAAGTGAKAAGSKPADTGVHAPAGPGADGAAAAAAAGASASVPLYGPVTPDGAFNSAGGDAAFALAATADAAAAVSPAEAAAAASELPHRSVAVTGINAIVASPHGRLRLQISAPLVISAAGALHSPLLLRRSGVRNPHLGQNLRLHPVVGVCAVFDQGVACDAQALQAAREKLAAEARACATADDAAAGDASATAVAAEKKKQHRRPAVTSPAATSGADSFNTLCDAAAAEGVPESAVFRDGRLRAGVVTREVDCFRGAIMTSVNNIVENYEGDGYGARIETPSVHPGVAAFACNWRNSDEYKRCILGFRRICPLIVLARDKHCGYVSQGPHGQPRVTYRVSGKDKRTLTKGLIQAYHMLAAAGATRLVPPQFGLSAVDIDPALGTRDPRFVELMRTIETEGVEQSRAGLFSAHQMGTCRMHGVKSEGVVRPTGESWDVGNLYICDASVFPTSSGVNPMLTVLAMSQCIAAHANRRLELLLAARSAPRSPYIAAKL